MLVRIFGIRFALPALILALPAAAYAQPPSCPIGSPAFTFMFEDDFREMTLFRASDNNYTAGIRFSLSTPTHDASTGDPNRLHRWFPLRGLAGPCHRTTYSIGGSMYTPTQISDPNLIQNDRAYAGWAYIAYAIDAYSTDLKVNERFEANIGVIGQMVGGRAIQTWVHEQTNSPIPRGWSHQIRNAPGAYVLYLHKRRITDPAALNWADVAVSWGGTLGNIFTYPMAGASLRLGYHANDIGPASPPQTVPSSIQTALPSPLHPSPASKNFAAYVFVEGTGKLVLRNIFIDGGSFADEPHTIKKTIPIADFQIGFVVRYKAVALTYRTFGRTREFDLQQRPHYYGSFGLTIGRTYNP